MPNDAAPAPALQENLTPQQQFDRMLSQRSAHLLAQAAHLAASPGDPNALAFKLVKLAAAERQTILLLKFMAKYGTKVLAGPFAGLDMVLDDYSEPSYLPRLLGLYEYPLTPILERIVATPYSCIINIGCGEGHYAIGLARAIPAARVIAADLVPWLRDRCQRLAALNGVEGRVTVVGELDPAGLNEQIPAAPDGRTLVICDIEGAEQELLDIGLAPRLSGCDILVELHEAYRPGITELMQQRFAATHDFRFIDMDEGRPALPKVANSMQEIDRMLLTFEAREGYTPWGWLTAKG